MKFKSLIVSTCLIITSLSAQLTVRAQYMQYRDSGKEWFVEVVPEGIFDGKNVQDDNMDQYYFEWRHIYSDGSDSAATFNDYGKILHNPDGHIDDPLQDTEFYDAYLIIKDGFGGTELARSDTINIGRNDVGISIQFDMPGSGSHLEEWVWRDKYLGNSDENLNSDAGKYFSPIYETNETILVPPGRPSTFRADTGMVGLQKFHSWEGWNTIENYHTFNFFQNGFPDEEDGDEENDIDLIGIYQEVFPVTITSNYSITNSVQFYDPWRYEDTNTPMEIQNKGINAMPYFVNGQKEVFLDQNPNFLNDDPSYKLNANVAPGYVFSHWRTSSESGAQFSNQYSNETSVVFKEEGTTVTAVYMPRLTGTISEINYGDGLVLYGNVQLNGSLNIGDLIIENGTQITISNNNGITILGDIQVNGSSSNPVTLSGNFDIGLETFGHIDISYLHISGGNIGLKSQGGSGTIENSQFNNNNKGGDITSTIGALSILSSTFSNNTTYGLYVSYSDYIHIRNSYFNNNQIGITYNRSGGSLRDNHYSSNVEYGAWFYNNSSPLVSKYYGGENTTNDHFENNGKYGSYVSDGSYPSFGNPWLPKGYNYFSNNNNYDIFAVNTGIINAQNNWWANGPNVSNNVLTNPTANSGDGPNNTFKIKGVSELDSLTQVVFDADSLIADSLFDEGLSLYKSVISSFPDDTASTMALSRLYTLIPQLSEETELYTTMDEVHANHSGTLTGRTALFMDVALTSKSSGLDVAIDQSQSLLNINEAYDAGAGEKAAALLQHSDLLTQREALQNSVAGKEREPNEISEDVLTLYETIANQYPNTGAAEIVSLLYGIEKPKTKDAVIPDDFTLFPAYPNPFNPSTSIKFYLPIESEIKLTIYNLLGEVVKTLSQGHKTRGFHKVQWNGENQNREQVPSGMYFYTLRINPFNNDEPITKNGKMLLLK